MKIEELYYDLNVQAIDEKNWKINKWRSENPIDYFKAIYILNRAENPIVQMEVFKAIYKVISLYVPDVLYKYYSFSDNEVLNDKKLNTLNESKIYMSDISNFNDPFDSKGFYYHPEELSKLERLKSLDGKIIDDFSDFIKATSLTENNVYALPMWAHYAGNHVGFCASYDMKENLELRSCTFPIQYTEDRLDVTNMMEKFVKGIISEIEKQKAKKKIIIIDDLSIVYMASLLCNIKHISWNYEKEFRCTVGALDKGMPYIKAKAKEIYIGKNCSIAHEQRLLEIAEKLNIPAYKMVFDEYNKNYSLITKAIK